MVEKDKDFIERAILDVKKIQEALESNTKEILRSVSREEIDKVVKESVNEDYEEEDVESDEETTDDEVGGDEGSDDTDSEVSDDADDLGMGDSEGNDGIELDGAELDGEYEIGGDEDTTPDYEEELDMTNSSDLDVISVYKKLTGNDEIEVVVDDESGDIKVSVNEPGEFVIKKGAQDESSELESDELTPTDYSFEDDMDGDNIDEGMFGKFMNKVGGFDKGVKALLDTPEGQRLKDSFNNSEDENQWFKENVRNLVMLINKSGDTAKSSSIQSKDIFDYLKTNKPVSETEMVYEIALDEMEDIDSVKAPLGKENDDNWAGDNLEGGFDEDQTYAKAEGPMVMSENDELFEVEMEDDETLEEKIQVGKGRGVHNTLTDIKGAGGDANNVKAPNVTTESVKPKLSINEVADKYNRLLTEAKELKLRNDEYKTTLKQFRNMLAETVVFNSNLTYVTRLFMEHSTTKAEKEAIIKRFDEGVSTLKESKKMYKTIASELSSKKPITESIDKMVTTSKSSKLNESTAYVDNGTARVLDLMNRVER